MRIITILLALLALPASAYAVRNDSGAVGGFQLNVGSASSSGSEPTLTRSTAYGGGFELGYMVNNNVSLEIAYTSVGGPQWDVVSVTNSSLTANLMIFIKPSDINANALYIQLGMGMLTTAANLSGVPNSRSNQGGILGIGYEFNHGEMAAFRLGFSVYDTGYNQVRTLSAGPVWKF